MATRTLLPCNGAPRGTERRTGHGGHNSLNASTATSVGGNAPSSRPSGLMTPFENFSFRIDAPAGLGALAITVRPPPRHSTRHQGHLELVAQAFDQRAQVGQCRIVGNRRQRRGQVIEHGVIDVGQRRLQPPLLQAA